MYFLGRLAIIIQAEKAVDSTISDLSPKSSTRVCMWWSARKGRSSLLPPPPLPKAEWLQVGLESTHFSLFPSSPNFFTLSLIIIIITSAVFSSLSIEAVLVCDEVDCEPQVTKTTGATYSVEVGLRCLGEFKVDDHVHSLNVNASCQQV